MTKEYRLAVTVCDVSATVHAGGDPVHVVRTFPLPEPIRAYIQSARKDYRQITLSLDVTELDNEKVEDDITF